MPDRDFLDELIDERIARNPNFPAMVESYHDRRLARRIEEDPGIAPLLMGEPLQRAVVYVEGCNLYYGALLEDRPDGAGTPSKTAGSRKARISFSWARWRSACASSRTAAA